MQWEQGRATIDELIATAQIERVQPSREQADALLMAARAHIKSAVAVQDSDPDGAYSLVYDGARKALAAVLANEGLRATSRGGHVAVYEAVSAQLVPPMAGVVRPFNRMRRRRNEVEYPSVDNPDVTASEVVEDLPRAVALIDTAERVIPEMDVY